MILVPERLRSFLQKAYVVCVVIAMVWALSSSGTDLAKAVGSLFVMESIVYVVAWVLMVLLLGLLWSVWLRRVEGVSLRASEWVPIQGMAWSGRYLPGKVGLLMGKLALVQSHRIDLRALTLSVLVEQAAFLLAGACVTVVLFSPERLGAWPWLPSGIGNAWSWLIFLAMVTALVLMPAMVAISARALCCNQVALKSLLATAMLALHAIPHLVIGAAFYGLVLALFPEVSDFPPTHFVAVLALAHVAGVLAVFAPAGLGVREVVLAEGLRGILSFDEALLLASILRVLTLAADGMIVIVAAVAWRQWKRKGK